MRLLWRSPDDGDRRRPGPKRRLTVDQIVTASISVADENGDVSMRAVAERLGVTPMALYSYVPDKETLLALMYDSIHADVSDPQRVGADWRRAVVTWAEELVDLYVSHPWALQVSYARPVLGPHEQVMLERLVAHLRSEAIPPGLLRRAVGMLLHAVRGTARTIAEARESARTSGVSEEEWWEEVAGALAAAVPDFADRFPHTVWLLTDDEAAGGDEAGDGYVDRQARASLRVGLELLFDGLVAAAGLTESDHGDSAP